jgi:hypothetical protein
MFSNDMIEKQVNEAEIDDIDKDVFQEFLNFIYTAKWTQIKLMAGRLLRAVDKYDIMDLKSVKILFMMS